MPAVAGFDDLHAWLIRGFVEAGLPDHTGGGRPWHPDGALNLENVFSDQGAGGVLLEFFGQAGAEPVPEDEYTYQALVVHDATGARVVVRCPETVYFQVFPADRPDTLGATILAHVRQHNARFTAWRSQGGEVSYADRLSVQEVRGTACDRGLVALLGDLRRRGVPLEAGPSQGWWVQSRAAIGRAIGVGKGTDPTYHIGPKSGADPDSAENRAFVEKARKVGTVLLVLSGLTVVYLAAGGTLAYWRYGVRVSAGLVASGVLWAALAAWAGVLLRRLRSLTLARVLAVVLMLPCFGPCCAAGLPVGAWALWVLRNPRARVVFQ